MQEIEATVREDQFLPLSVQFITELPHCGGCIRGEISIGHGMLMA
jgi:hypothetical protein